METRLEEIRIQAAELLSEALGLIQTIRPDVTRLDVNNRGGVSVWSDDFNLGYNDRSTLYALNDLPKRQLIRDTRIKQLKSEIKQLEEDK